MAAMQAVKGKSKAREPPSSLFLDLSPTASLVSLPGTMTSIVPVPQENPPSTNGSILGGRDGSSPAEARRTSMQGGLLHPNAATSGALGPSQGPPAIVTHRESTRTTDRTDALWAEMQATLEEVELSASGGTRVFGPDHDRKLGELRLSQIALAQAWARSEADEAIETGGALSDTRVISKVPTTGPEVVGAEGGKTDGGAHTADATGKSTVGTGGTKPASSSLPAVQEMTAQKAKEEETEVDILLARQRREANDRYFQRVNQGVLDVAAKLEDVAIAMRAVEQESKDLWADVE